MENEQKIELKGVPGFQEDDWIVIKKYSFRQKTRLRGKSIFLNEDNKPRVDFGELQFWATVYGTKQASFLKGKDGKVLIDPSTEQKRDYYNDMMEGGDFIFKKISKFNNLEDIQVMQKK